MSPAEIFEYKAGEAHTNGTAANNRDLSLLRRGRHLGGANGHSPNEGYEREA